MRARTVLTRCLALLVGVVLSSPMVLAQNDMGEVQVQMAEARRHFEALEYEQAVPAQRR